MQSLRVEAASALPPTLQLRGKHGRKRACATAATTRLARSCTTVAVSASVALLALRPASAFLAPVPRCNLHTNARERICPSYIAVIPQPTSGERGRLKRSVWLHVDDSLMTHEIRSRRRRSRSQALSATASDVKMASDPPAEGAEFREEKSDGAVGKTRSVPGYGIFEHDSNELVRIELEEVPVERSQDFLRKWAKRRVSGDDPGWQGSLRPANRYGVPKTNMAVSETRSNLGVTLTFDGSPTDVLDIRVYPLSGGGSCMTMNRGVDGLAKLGGMGPHVASLVQHSEKQIKEKLELDMSDFATEYHDRVAKGLAPAANQQREQEAGRDVPTVLGNGVIDVTPPSEPSTPEGTDKRRDKSMPPPVPRMVGKDQKSVEIDPERPFAGEDDPFPMETLFFGDDPNDARNFDQEAYDLFNTMKQEERGGERVVGSTKSRGSEGFFADMRANSSSEAELVSMFEAGKNASAKGSKDQTLAPAESEFTQLEIMIGGDTGLRGGIDIFAGPPRPIGGRVEERTQKMEEGPRVEGEEEEEGDVVGGTYTMYDEDGDPVVELTAKEMASLDEDKLTAVMVSLDVLIQELVRVDRERWPAICFEYADLYLDKYYILAMRARIPKANKLQKEAMSAVNQAAVDTVQRMAEAHQRLEMEQLEKIRDICEAAIEDMDTLPDRVRQMKPLFDKNFVAYLGYAIQKEREDIERRGMNPDREPTRWLQVLGVIQKGVFAELEKDVIEDCIALYKAALSNAAVRYGAVTIVAQGRGMEPTVYCGTYDSMQFIARDELISHVFKLRKPEERFALLNVTIETLPSMYVRGFKRTATNIVEHFRTMDEADCPDHDLRDMVLEMGKNLETLMSEERMAVLCNEVDTWAAEKAKQDSVEARTRRIKEYEAEEREMRRRAEGAFGQGLTPEEIEDQRDKEELERLASSLRSQNLIGMERSSAEIPLLEDYSGGASDTEDYIGGDRTKRGEDDLRRKLRQLSEPGGALESDSRGIPEIFAPGGFASARGQRTGAAFGVDDDLLREAREGIVDLGETFDGRAEEVRRKRRLPPESVEDTDEEDENEKDETSGDEEWASFDDDDWRAKTGMLGAGAEEGKPKTVDSPRGADVPGLLGGERFEGLAGPDRGSDDAVAGEEADSR